MNKKKFTLNKYFKLIKLINSLQIKFSFKYDGLPHIIEFVHNLC